MNYIGKDYYRRYFNIKEEVDQNIKKSYAVFALIKFDENSYAGTTRAADRNESGRVGLPGGKVDPGESDIEALIRECGEEGWKITPYRELSQTNPIYEETITVDEYDYPRFIRWYKIDRKYVKQLTDYKEKNRIKPIILTKEQLLKSGYGNQNLKNFL